MRHTIHFFIILALFSITSQKSYAQCASSFSGFIGMKQCSSKDTITSYFSNAQIVHKSNSRFVIRNFAAIPNSVMGGIEDTIVVNVNCTNDSLSCNAVSYQVSGVSLSYAGSGKLYQDSIIIVYNQTNPNGSQTICYTYRKGLTVSNKLQNFALKSSFRIYPNPVKSNLFVEEIDLKYNSFEIFNSSGAKVKTINSPNNPIDLSDLSKGVYHLKIKTENNQLISKKFVKL